MKKLLAVLICAAMLLAMGAVMTSAVELVNGTGLVEIKWDAAAADKITFDGDIAEWRDNGYQFTTISKENLAAWAGVVPEDFKINAYFVSDADYLYVAFFIADSSFCRGSGASQNTYGGYDGDSFQLAVDFNSEMKAGLNSGGMDFGNNKSIFYSFCCDEPGNPEAFNIHRQEGATSTNRILSKEAGDDIDGCANLYEGGWCAEFKIAWDIFYQDLLDKSQMTSEQYVAAFNAENNLSLGMTICYINREEGTAGSSTIEDGRTWMAGTFNKEAPQWLPTEAGIDLVLGWAEDRVMSCEGIQLEGIGGNGGSDIIVPVLPDLPDPDDDPDIDAPVDDPDDEESSVADDTTEEAETTTAAATTKAPDADEDEEAEGCGSVVGAGAAVMVLTAAAAAVVLKKKD